MAGFSAATQSSAGQSSAGQSSTGRTLTLRNYANTTSQGSATLAMRLNVIAWFTERFFLNDEITVSVNEIACIKQGCPPLETVIGIFAEGASRRFKFQKPLAAMTMADVYALDPETRGVTDADMCC